MRVENKRRIYSAEDSEAVFPLGGIGTGTVSIDSRGHLLDFELFNKPDKHNEQPYTFFAIHSESESGYKQSKILEAELRTPYSHSHGFHAWNFSGAPRFRNSELSVSYPIAELSLSDDTVPLEISLKSFSPFIPGNADESGIPGIYFTWKVKNTSSETQKINLAFSAANLCGWVDKRDVFSKAMYEPGSVNTLYETEKFKAILMHNENISKTSTDYTEMGIAALPLTGQEVQDKVTWQEGQWWDGMQDFWNDFSELGIVRSTSDLLAEETSVHHSPFTIGSIALADELAAGEEAEFKFLYVWYHPNRARRWGQFNIHWDAAIDGDKSIIKNYYAHWGKPREVIDLMQKKYEYYNDMAHKFVDALFSTNVPEALIDALSTNLTTIRTQTCFRVEGGNFYGWEGCFDFEGSCPGNCTHVWNYAQSLAYFFPELERNMRETEYLTELRENGKMNFRAMYFLDNFYDDFHPASDGQLGSIVRVYREWKISGDDEFLRRLWPGIKLSVQFALNSWDLDNDGVLEAMQHNTYDIEFYGISTLANSIWITALSALAIMADYLGDTDYAAWARETEVYVSKVLDEVCYNGEYYSQNIEDVDAHKYQYGSGVLADQLLGVTWARQLDLPISLDEEHVKSAVYAIYKYNIPAAIRETVNLQRGYAFNDERGLLLCTWPSGNKPRIPFVYSDEVWPGVEYSVASLLLSSGFDDEAIDMVEHVRNRFNGKTRNPFNEPECGHHYARSLASFGPYMEYVGLRVDTPNKKLSLRVKDSGSYFVIANNAWGTVEVEFAMGDGDKLVDSETSKISWKLKSIYGDLSEYDISVTKA